MARLLKSALNQLGLVRPLQKSLIRLGFSSLQWHPYLDQDLQALVPSRDLWVNSGDSLNHFFRWIYEYRVYLTLLCEMRRDAAVLELGCHHGRTMLALLDYLKPPGRYEGLDILSAQIQFAQNRIHSAYSNFNFTHADVYSGLYNPNGRFQPDTYRFPYDDGVFDIVYAASLFTHLMPAGSLNYFRQSRRVLRRGGLCLFSFFLLDSYRGPGTSIAKLYEFDHPFPNEEGVAVQNPTIPEYVIAYSRAAVERIAHLSNFKLKRIIPGYWSNAHECSVNEHDLVLLEAN